jgi:hypothetical protein
MNEIGGAGGLEVLNLLQDPSEHKKFLICKKWTRNRKTQ